MRVAPALHPARKSVTLTPAQDSSSYQRSALCGTPLPQKILYLTVLTKNPMSAPSPQYVYKIGNSFPSGLENDEALPISDLDKTDGFIHLSTAEQVPSTIGRFFKTTKEITLLKFVLKDIESKTKWELSSSHGVFPHVYGDLFSRDIFDRKTYTIEDPAGWEALLKADKSFLQ